MNGKLKELTIISLPEITSHVGDVQSPHTNLLKSKKFQIYSYLKENRNKVMAYLRSMK